MVGEWLKQPDKRGQESKNMPNDHFLGLHFLHITRHPRVSGTTLLMDQVPVTFHQPREVSEKDYFC